MCRGTKVVRRGTKVARDSCKPHGPQRTKFHVKQVSMDMTGPWPLGSLQFTAHAALWKGEGGK